MEEMIWDVGIKNIPGQGWRDCNLEHVKGRKLENYGTETSLQFGLMWIFSILKKYLHTFVCVSVHACLCVHVCVRVCVHAHTYTCTLYLTKSFWFNQKINLWRIYSGKNWLESRFLCESSFLIGIREGQVICPEVKVFPHIYLLVENY